MDKCGATKAWQNGADYNAICRLIDNGRLTPGQLAALETIGKLIGKPALLARSSAHYDSKGTGAYESFCFLNKQGGAIEFYFKEVLKSYSRQRLRNLGNTIACRRELPS